MSTGLYKHQKDALKRMHNGCILCGGVGTGKSRTALAYFVTRECKGSLPFNRKQSGLNMKQPKLLYVITTARKRDTKDWEQELIPFGNEINMTVDSWNNIAKYTDITDSFFIFDEQRVVGSGTWSKSFLKIAKRNHWIMLSATPGDVWMDYCSVFIANGFYRNKTDFISKHVVYNRFTKWKIDRYVGTKQLEKLRASIVVEMPYKKQAVRHHEYITVGYDTDVYKQVKENRWNVYESKPIENAAEYCYTLRKVINSDPRRCSAIARLIRNHKKLIVFYNFDYELEMLRDLADKLNVNSAEWNGHKHEPIPKDSSWIYLVQYTAGSEGWNCIDTDTEVFFSQNYSYKTMEQSSGRIDRLNTPYTDLYYYHIISESEIDKQIRRCVKRKKKFNEKTFAPDFSAK